MDKIFSQNPKLDIYYKTSDDSAFLLHSDAKNHAITLEDKTVHKVTRSKSNFFLKNEQSFVQTGENPDGSPKVEENKTRIFVDSLPPKIQSLLNVVEQSNLGKVAEKVQTVLEKGAIAGTDTVNQNADPAGDNTNDVPKTEVKLTPKQQAQVDYTNKFGEAPADEYTKNELLEAIEKCEKLVVDIKND